MLFLFKYEPYIKNLSLPLAYLIISHFALTEKQKIFANPKAIFMSVPLFKKKEKSRGYNQSKEIAEILSIYYRLPLQKNNLIKVKNTKSQTNFSKKERVLNIANSFTIKNPSLVEGKTIFLIDDVFTTGATMEECTRTLKKAGAKKVFGIVVAREGLNP